MVRAENRLVLVGGVLIAVITSCVQLPERLETAAPVENTAEVTGESTVESAVESTAEGSAESIVESTENTESSENTESTESVASTEGAKSMESAAAPSAEAVSSADVAPERGGQTGPDSGIAAPTEDAAAGDAAALAGSEPASGGDGSPNVDPALNSSAPAPSRIAPGLAPARQPVSRAQNGFALRQVEKLCEQIGNKLGSVSVQDCLRQDFHFGGGFSINQRPLVVKELPPERHDANSIRIFLMGGIHGDEYSSISIIFKWLELFSPYDPEGKYYWRFAPLVNPDGLLDGQARRQNANGVDLNRNFPSLDWNAHATDYWQDKTGRNPRRFPGDSAASEPEVQWIVHQIEEFDPDVIVSVHAPYHLLDFDGPSEAPEKIGELYLHQLGVYPGSLGNYAGLDKNIPVVTLELPSAGILPTPEQIRLMWLDLVAWLEQEGDRPETN